MTEINLRYKSTAEEVFTKKQSHLEASRCGKLQSLVISGVSILSRVGGGYFRGGWLHSNLGDRNAHGFRQYDRVVQTMSVVVDASDMKDKKVWIS